MEAPQRVEPVEEAYDQHPYLVADPRKHHKDQWMERREPERHKEQELDGQTPEPDHKAQPLEGQELPLDVPWLARDKQPQSPRELSRQEIAEPVQVVDTAPRP